MGFENYDKFIDISKIRKTITEKYIVRLELDSPRIEDFSHRNVGGRSFKGDFIEGRAFNYEDDINEVISGKSSTIYQKAHAKFVFLELGIRSVILGIEIDAEYDLEPSRLSRFIGNFFSRPLFHDKKWMLLTENDSHLFNVAEIVRYQEEEFKHKVPVLYDRAGSTDKSCKYFYNNIRKLRDIVEVNIYFDERDAVIDNYFEPLKDYYFNDLQYISVPHMILKDINDKEMWLAGVNCGYVGKGTRGSKEILEHLEIPQDIIDLVDKYRVIKIKKDLQTKEFIKEYSDSKFKNADASVQIFFRKDRLVIIEDKRYAWKREINPSKIVEEYEAFIPSPEGIKIFITYDQAKEYGYISKGNFGYEEPYRIIIEDRTGRELWLNPIIYSEKALSEQPVIQELLIDCGFEKLESEKVSLSDKILAWLNIRLKQTMGKPIYIKKK